MKKLSQAAVNKLLEAFDAMVIAKPWGQAYYRTEHDVPMAMPYHVEKKVRAALKALGRRNEKVE